MTEPLAFSPVLADRLGVSTSNGLRGPEDQVVLSCITQDEVIQRFGENNGDLVAENLVEQLLKVVTKDEALKMIQQHG